MDFKEPLSSYQLIAIVGPTASGKSDYAEKLALKIVNSGNKCALINADSFSLYRKMDIGTAKPNILERKKLENQGVKYYQIDILDPLEISNAALYQASTLKIINFLHKNNSIPILVGGSGLYVRTITDDFKFQPVDLSLRKQLEKRAEAEGTEHLYQELLNKDPNTAKTLNPENTRRIIRALEVIQITGLPFIPNLPQYTNRFPKTLQLGLKLSREEIDKKIDIRTQKMRDLGLENEVRNLYQNNELGPTAKKAIGYSEFIDYFENKNNPADNKPLTLDSTFTNIANHTKRLVRRQLSWFTRDPRILWV
ncbi:MAG: tRNA (adenosine(37)-N6)-dimethylallyltransferase MiaA [Candidatus Ancillula sp.]|jgi:tRNA dimethylallyltransferase|nr:tRNA (adenosine(37)-N6)-dimethylallyltransferase MiaA [Candidatus Ancillula sp.]